MLTQTAAPATPAQQTPQFEATIAALVGGTRLERRRDELGLLSLAHRATVALLTEKARVYGIHPAEYLPLRQALAAERRCRDLIALVEWEQHFPPSR